MRGSDTHGMLRVGTRHVARSAAASGIKKVAAAEKPFCQYHPCGYALLKGVNPSINLLH